MRKLSFALAAVAFLILTAGPTSAAFTRTYVSNSGDDANDCSLATPCRFFSGALPKTNIGGEIVALSDGEYGSILITKSVTLMAAPGVHAALGRNVNEDVVTVNIRAGGTVVLRNLYISRIASGGVGILVKSGATLHVEGCTVARFTGNSGLGISILSGTAKTYIKDSFIRDNGTGIFAGGRVLIDNTRIENNNSTGTGFGVGVPAGAKVTIRNSTVAGHSVGLSLQISTNAVLTVEDCVIFNNTDAGIAIVGLNADGGTVRVSNSVVTQNGKGFSNVEGVFESRGNNTVRGNMTNTSGPITLISGT